MLVSQGTEWLCMYVNLSESIYRLSCLRYLFLIYLGNLWTRNKMSRSINNWQLILSIISALILIALYYSNRELSPFLYDSNWRIFHWICYFWPAFMLPWLIYMLYDKVPAIIKMHIGEIGKRSYEIFLVQMFVFAVYPVKLFDTRNIYVNVLIRIIFTIAASIIPVIVYKRWQTSRTRNINLVDQ